MLLNKRCGKCVECVVNGHKIVLSPVVGGLEGVSSSGALIQRAEIKGFAKQARC